MSPAPIVRHGLGGFTIVCAALALATGDARWWAGSAAAGILWSVWDFLVQYVFVPLEHWIADLMGGSALSGATRETRPSLDETIAYLERHLANPTSRQVDINAAVRLEEIYRAVKKNPDRAREVIRTIRERYPDAPELDRYV